MDFEKQILPIFKESCFDCHQKERTDEKTGKIKKPKGKFRMDSAAMLIKGGSEGSNLVPGDAAKSTVYTSVTLPESDDLAMPPEGKGDRLTKEQQELIKKWINEGAKLRRPGKALRTNGLGYSDFRLDYQASERRPPGRA